jgi:hypothetical protein
VWWAPPGGGRGAPVGGCQGAALVARGGRRESDGELCLVGRRASHDHDPCPLTRGVRPVHENRHGEHGARDRVCSPVGGDWPVGSGSASAGAPPGRRGPEETCARRHSLFWSLVVWLVFQGPHVSPGHMSAARLHDRGTHAKNMYVCMHVYVHGPITQAESHEDIYSHGCIGPPVGTRVRRLGECHRPDPLLAAALVQCPVPKPACIPGRIIPVHISLAGHLATVPPQPAPSLLPEHPPSTRRAACLGPASWGAETDRLEACHAHRGRRRDAAEPGSQGQAVRPVAVNWRTGGTRASATQPGIHLAHPSGETMAPRAQRTARLAPASPTRPSDGQVQSQRGLRARGRGPLCMGPTGHLTRYHTKSLPPESSSGPGTFARTTSAQVSPVDLCEGEWQCRSSEHIFPA